MLHADICRLNETKRQCTTQAASVFQSTYTLKQECKELQHRIDESLKETGQPQVAKHEAIAEAA